MYCNDKTSLNWTPASRRVAPQCTDSCITSVIEDIGLAFVERDGLRQHVVVVGSTTEELQQTPERLSPWLIKPSGAKLSVVQM
jgi:hypothetical protein